MVMKMIKFTSLYLSYLPILNQDVTLLLLRWMLLFLLLKEEQEFVRFMQLVELDAKARPAKSCAFPP